VKKKEKQGREGINSQYPLGGGGVKSRERNSRIAPKHLGRGESFRAERGGLNRQQRENAGDNARACNLVEEFSAGKRKY